MNPATLSRCILAAVLLSAAALSAQPSSDPAELVKQARRLNNEGKQDEALALYQKALQASPDLFEAHMGAGAALDLQGNYAEARRHFEKAIASATPQAKVQALRSMAVSYAFEGKAKSGIPYDQQVVDADLAKQDFTAAADVSNELARLLLESGDLNDSYKWYQSGHETALRKPSISPAEKDLWDFRWEHAQARLAARRGKHDEAEKHVAAAKAILDKGTNPDQARFYPYLTGYVAFYKKDYKDAIADLQKADQRDPFILSLLAQACEKTGENAQAMELYRKILTFNMHNPTNAFARPLARKKIGT